MANRLVLSLSHAANERKDSEFRTRTGFEPPVFASGPALGNIGGPIPTFLDDLDDVSTESDGTSEECILGSSGAIQTEEPKRISDPGSEHVAGGMSV